MNTNIARTVFVIKINKKRYLHVKTLGIDIPSQFIKLRLEQYIGSKNEWNKLTSLTVSIHFQDASETGLPCTWEFEDITLYEEQLSKYIPHMKWNEKQINMWNDLFGIENINDLYAIILDKPPEYKDDLNDDAIAIIYGSSDLRKLKEECGPFMHIIASGQEAKDIFEKSGSKNLFIEYLKAITLINYQLYAHRNTTKRNSDSQIVAEPIVNSESDTKNGHNSIKRLIGTITITSEQPPKLPTEESIANYKKLSWPCKGGVRHMKSGKVVPYASHTKHRHIDTNDTKEGM